MVEVVADNDDASIDPGLTCDKGDAFCNLRLAWGIGLDWCCEVAGADLVTNVSSGAGGKGSELGALALSVSDGGGKGVGGLSAQSLFGKFIPLV